MKRHFIQAILFLLPAFSAKAQQNLDFWLGDWDAYSLLHGGPLIGENHVSKILGGKVIFEHWADCIGTEGHSFTLFDSVQHCWKQTWVDNSGAMTEFTGLLRGDTVVFTTRPTLEKDGRTAVNRMMIARVSLDELWQQGEVSYNNSLDWTTKFRFKYRRKEADAARFYDHSPKPLVYFSGQIEYAYTYESTMLNADSLSQTKPRRSVFRYDGFNYQSQFIGRDTTTYFYNGTTNRCLSQTGARGVFECEDYGIPTDSVLSWRILETDEKVLGHPVCILEMQGKYFFSRFFVARDVKISPFTWKKHFAYNWAFYGDKAEGGLILKVEHRFKKYTMHGVATRLEPGGSSFRALELGDGVFEKHCPGKK